MKRYQNRDGTYRKHTRKGWFIMVRKKGSNDKLEAVPHDTGYSSKRSAFKWYAEYLKSDNPYWEYKIPKKLTVTFDPSKPSGRMYYIKETKQYY